MKLGLTMNMSKNGYPRWGESRYKKLREHGYSCVDYSMASDSGPLYTLSREESDRVFIHERELAASAGIEIFQVHGPWRWPSRDYTAEDRAERMQKMRESIRATALLGCKNWVIHPIMPFGIEDSGTENAEKTWEMNIEFMSRLLETAKEYNIVICLENMPFHNFSISKPEDILSFVQTLDDDNFKICLDTGHVSVFNDASPAEAVRLLRGEIRALHIHDNQHGMDLHMMPCFGIIDWQDFAKALKEIGFTGAFSIETLPSVKLPDDIFEEMCISLAKIGKRIAPE